MPAADSCAVEVRHFAGAHTDEFFFACRPFSSPDDPATQALAVWQSLTRALRDRGATAAHLLQETIHLRDIDRDLPAILEVRTHTFSKAWPASPAPTPVAIGQPPTAPEAAFVVAARASVPRTARTDVPVDLHVAGTCGCRGCRQAGGRLHRDGELVRLVTTNLYGNGPTTEAQAFDAFVTAERLLADCGLSFHDVVRTWIELRHIDRDYDALNRARRAFFASRGIDVRPASTGVQGRPFPPAHDVSLGLFAQRDAAAPAVAPVSTPLLNEAWSYGADFSRAVRVVDGNATTLWLSGTASIDEVGRSVHVGDFDAQARRMLDNLASILAGQGAGFADVVSATTYVRHRADGARLEQHFGERGFAGFPSIIVEAPLCRPELLCEAEAVALLGPARCAPEG